jgi:branched-chain amino acid transport system ATP-binding protein
MTDQIILEARGVTKVFNGLSAVAGVDYQLIEGQVAGVIGPNGAGKSTFFNLLTGLYTPTEGRVDFVNQEITKVPPDQRVVMGLGRTFQLVSVFNSLTVLDNLVLSVTRFTPYFNKKSKFFFADRNNCFIRENCIGAMEMVGIQDKEGLMTSVLSYGDKRKLEIAMALSLKPKVLLLDEPFAGLSDGEIDEIVNLINRIKVGLSIVIIEHKISKLLDLVEKLSVMHEGKIIFEGKPQEAISDREVRRVYWGEKDESSAIKC